jgi:hypothetical protein
MTIKSRRIGTLGRTIPRIKTALQPPSWAPWVRLAEEDDFRLSDGVDLPKKGVAMKATISGLAALFLALALTTAAQAWYEYSPPPVNAFTPGCYCYPCWGGSSYGQYTNWPPYCQPFQGFRPQVPMRGNDGGYRFARSPRDYFMVDP